MDIRQASQPHRKIIRYHVPFDIEIAHRAAGRANEARRSMQHHRNRRCALLAVEFKVKDTSARYEVSDDADLDMTIVASNDQTYTASFNTVTECTNFNHGDFQLEPGASVVGCVVFELPSNLRATDVKWTDASGLFNDWRVAP